MQDLKVTLVQANQFWEDKQANFSNYERLLEGVETDLILLPEMFQTGFSMNEEELGEGFEASLSIRWLKKMTKHLNAAIYTSLIIREGGKYYNRGVFVFPNGEIKTYDKRKLFSLAGEDNHFTAGNLETIVSYKGWNFQLQICYDLRFPEIVRNRMGEKNTAYDAILYVANWPKKRAHHWKTLLVARAVENQCYVLGVNRIGIDANSFSYSGDSSVVTPLGETEQKEPNIECVLNTTLSAKQLEFVRKTFPFLQDR